MSLDESQRKLNLKSNNSVMKRLKRKVNEINNSISKSKHYALYNSIIAIELDISESNKKRKDKIVRLHRSRHSKSIIFILHFTLSLLVALNFK